tara:strand:- start:2987 stop:3508 length:522 start_codon:yes stop_codon:yes gene_type:complete
MKKILITLGMLLMTGSVVAPAKADLTHRMTSSTQLSVNGAYTDSTRIGSTYTVSGSNIKVASSDDHFGKLVTPSGTAAATLDAGTYDINTAGSAFSFSESFIAGDAVNTIGSGVDVTSGVVADMPAFGETLTMSGGVAGSLAGTILSSGVTTLTAGGAGTTATGQFVTELQLR